MSGFFISNSGLVEFMWNQTMKAIDALNNKVMLINQDAVQDAINNCDFEMAEKLINDYNLM